MGRAEWLYMCRGLDAAYSGTSVAAAVHASPGTLVTRTSLPYARCRTWTRLLTGQRYAMITGTETFEHVVNQIVGWVNPAPWSYGGEVNSWVWEVAKLIETSLDGIDLDVIFGHSLGGGLAAMIARHLAGQGKHVPPVIATIGAPRDFDSDAITASGFPLIDNLVGESDVVPELPPFGFGNILWFRPGQDWFLSSLGDIVQIEHSIANPASMLIALASAGTEPHHAHAYVQRLQAGMPDDPFKPQPGIVIRPCGCCP